MITIDADWMGRKNGKWFVVEVKHKEMFKPHPFYGQGRMKFYKETGIRCLFLVIDKDTKKIYWNWIDELEKTEHFTTKNGVRIYNLKYFHCAGTKVQVDLNGNKKTDAKSKAN